MVAIKFFRKRKGDWGMPHCTLLAKHVWGCLVPNMTKTKRNLLLLLYLRECENINSIKIWCFILVFKSFQFFPSGHVGKITCPSSPQIELSCMTASGQWDVIHFSARALTHQQDALLNSTPPRQQFMALRFYDEQRSLLTRRREKPFWKTPTCGVGSRMLGTVLS